MKIQNIPLLSLADEFGTPLYVYDAEKILAQYKKLHAAFPQVQLKIKYAMKALSNLAIVRLLHQAGAGIDAVSIEEVRLALHAGVRPEEIIFTPNNVPWSEIEEAVGLKVVINLDNLPFLERFGQQYGHTYPCCVRVNPHVEAGGNEKIMTGHKLSKFGISKEQFKEVHALVKKYAINVHGVHVHSGSEFRSPDDFLREASILFEVAREFPNLQFLDLGSGFKVAYREGDYVTDLAELGQKITAAFQDFCRRYGRELELWCEPGKLLVSESGYLLVQATVVKETPDCTFVGVNSGLNHLIRPMFYGAYHEIINLSHPRGKVKEYNVVGYICETDTLGSNRLLNEVREGDILAILNAGAYGFTMSSNYNSRPRPAEVLVRQGKPILVRRRETLDDMLQNQIEVKL